MPPRLTHSNTFDPAQARTMLAPAVAAFSPPKKKLEAKGEKPPAGNGRGNLAVGEDDENTEIDNSEMVYLEFTECHGAIGSFMRPDPYNVLDMRLDSFISEDVVPPCRAMVRFRGKGLKEIPKPEELA